MPPFLEVKRQTQMPCTCRARGFVHGTTARHAAFSLSSTSAFRSSILSSPYTEPLGLYPDRQLRRAGLPTRLALDERIPHPLTLLLPGGCIQPARDEPLVHCPPLDAKHFLGTHSRHLKPCQLPRLDGEAWKQGTDIKKQQTHPRADLRGWFQPFGAA